jgi:putative polyhydroxyalkanoate system protein
MADIHIRRTHEFGLDKARELANQWIEDASKKLSLTCKLEPGEQEDKIHFERSGIKGVMRVNAEAFELEAKLGMMLAAFKPMVEAEIEKNLSHVLSKGKQA